MYIIIKVPGTLSISHLSIYRVIIMLFEGEEPSSAQSLLIALCSEITPDSFQGNIEGIEDQT